MAGQMPGLQPVEHLCRREIRKSFEPRGELSLGTKEDPAPIHEIDTAEEGRVLSSGIGEFDRVLGGGLVPAR